MATVFRGTIEFFEKIGIFDVVLPFLLVFTIVFAILDKTRIFGSEQVDEKKYPKKNINAIVAFAVAFLVVASSKLVEIITTVSSQMVVLLMLVVFFLLLIGTFFKEGEDVVLEKGWKTFFMTFMFVGMVLIFADAIKTESGVSWLEWFIRYVLNNLTSNVVASLVLMIAIILFIMYIIREPKAGASTKKEE